MNSMNFRFWFDVDGNTGSCGTSRDNLGMLSDPRIIKFSQLFGYLIPPFKLRYGAYALSERYDICYFFWWVVDKKFIYIYGNDAVIHNLAFIH